MVKVSIIVPIYKVEKYINRCIESLIKQTLKDIEIILVDDESPDNCPSICDQFAHSDMRIKVIHKKNEGLGMARNSGLKIATGEFVTFVDSDDFVDIKTYETIYNAAKENKLDVCYFNYCRYTNKKIQSSIKKWDKAVFFSGKEMTNNFLLDMIGPQLSEKIDIKFSMSVCMAIYKLDIIKRNNIQFVSEREIASEDLIFHLDYIPYVDKIGYLPNTFYYYFINPSSITTTYSEAKYNRLIALADKIKNELSKMYTEDRYMPHYQSQLLRIYKAIMKFESISKAPLLSKRNRISTICKHERLKVLFKTNIYNYALKNKLFIICLKYRLVLLIIFLYNLWYIRKKISISRN